MSSNRQSRTRVLVYALCAATVVAIAGAVSMLLLHRTYQRALHEAAADAVLTRGRVIAADLAAHSYVTRIDDAASRAGFRDVVHALARLEPSLQYVAVEDAGVIAFQEQVGGIRSPDSADRVRINRRRVDLGETDVSVVSFSLTVDGGDGTRTVEVALRRDALSREERDPSLASTAMFRTALLTMTLSLASMALIVGWFVRRELRRSDLRRDAEHLAFAGALANGIIHDVRNPISSLGLDVQMLQREVDRDGGGRTDRLRDLAGRVLKTLGRVDNVFKEFLYVSAPRQGEAERFDLRDAVRDCADLLRPRFERAGVDLTMVMGDAACPILGHSVDLKRATINLLTNALEASDGGAVEIRVAREGSDVTMDVRDTGSGIDAGTRRKVFEMFYTTKPGGTGLGLTLSKAAVESHAGRIRLESAPGRGTTVHVVLPAAPDAEAPA